MSFLLLDDVSKVYPGKIQAVSNFSLGVEKGEIVVLAGPSGCGKSTTLRMVAGLERVTNGRIIIEGIDATNLVPKDRNVAMVSQGHALYPHMSVYENMAFGLKMRKVPKKQIDQHVHRVANMLGIESLLDRYPKTLSGGQCQRVAMGRAIVREPLVFLMDEPLSNLDAKLRIQMRSVISQIHQGLNSTFMYVTHDQAEGMSLATKIVVMDNGRIQQIGSPWEVYNEPANLFVAGFIGSPQMNLIEAEIYCAANSYMIRASELSLRCPDRLKEDLKRDATERRSVMIGFRPEDVSLVPSDKGAMRAIVSGCEYLGCETVVHCDVSDSRIVVRTDSQIRLRRGDVVGLDMSGRNVHLFDKVSGRRIGAERV